MKIPSLEYNESCTGAKVFLHIKKPGTTRLPHYILLMGDLLFFRFSC